MKDAEQAVGVMCGVGEKLCVVLGKVRMGLWEEDSNRGGGYRVRARNHLGIVLGGS